MVTILCDTMKRFVNLLALFLYIQYYVSIPMSSVTTCEALVMKAHIFIFLENVLCENSLFKLISCNTKLFLYSKTKDKALRMEDICKLNSYFTITFIIIYIL